MSYVLLVSVLRVSLFYVFVELSWLWGKTLPVLRVLLSYVALFCLECA